MLGLPRFVGEAVFKVACPSAEYQMDFACESDSTKASWIIKMCHGSESHTCVFKDASELANGEAECVPYLLYFTSPHPHAVYHVSMSPCVWQFCIDATSQAM